MMGLPSTPLDSVRAASPGSFIGLSRGLVHYELSGPEGGPLVVLVPGLSVPYATWDRNVPALAGAGYRVLRYEHYGRGLSDRPRLPYDLDLYVEQLREMLEALGLGRAAALVGLSMGGPVAAAAASRQPGLAGSVVLVDPLFEWPAPRGAAWLLARPLAGEALMVLKGRSILAGGQRGDFFDEAAYREFLPLYLPPLRYRGIGQAVLATIRSIPSWPLPEVYAALGRASLPTLIFWGREDATLPFEQSSRLLGLLPGAEFRPIARSGHVPHWEKPGEVNSGILDFLERNAIG
jgi:pimeloyl-ACP methyl ester carboxylesterase